MYSCYPLQHWDLDDPYEHPGDHVFLPGGNLRLVAALAADVPIFYSAPVTLVDYSGGPGAGVSVHTPAGLFQADAALVTVPLGVLKKGGLVFQPPLPARKQGAIKRLGFGLLNKVRQQGAVPAE
jgi:lysine-specific histone demethylase 1